MKKMYLVSPNVYDANSKYDKYREHFGETYAHHILISMGMFLTDICKKEILDCLDIPEERRENGLSGECLRVLKKYNICFTHDLLEGSIRIN